MIGDTVVFRERTRTLRVRVAGGATSTTVQAGGGEAVTTGAGGRTWTRYRSTWPAGDDDPDPGAGTVTHEHVAALGEGLRSLPGGVLRIVERRRETSVRGPGGEGHEVTHHVVVMVDGRAADGRLLRGRGWFTGPLIGVLPRDVAACVRAAADDAVGRGTAVWPWLAPVRMPVVFAAGTGGTLFHEVVGHRLEAEPGAAPPGEGERLATGGVTVVDDATLPGRWGSRRVDDEGAPTRRVVLLADGAVRGSLRARDTSGSGGNARREGYHSRPLARMSNTYLAPGPDRAADLLGGPAVLHCLEGGSAEVRPGSGDVVLRVRSGELLRHGERAGRHGGLTLLLTADTLTHGIEGIADDLAFRAARCVKESQAVPVGHGAPTFRLGGALVAGPAPGGVT